MSSMDEDINIRRRKITGKTSLIFLAVMLLLTFFSNTINNFSLPKVAYASPTSGALIKEITGTGNVKAKAFHDQYVRSSMKVKEVFVEAGNPVKKGQSLLTLDTSDIEKQLKDEQDKYTQQKLRLEMLTEAGSAGNLLSLDRAVQTAMQNLEKSQKNYESSKALYEAGAVTANDLTDAEAGLTNAKMDYEIARNNRDKAINGNSREIESTRLDINMEERKIAQLTEELSMGTVVAVCDGIVTELYYTEGMTANTSQPLYKIADIEKGFQFTATIDISAAEYLVIGDTAEISINSLNNRTIEGKVNQIKDNQQQVAVKKDIVINIPPDGLIGGESGTADFRKSMGSYGTLVSNPALGQDINGYFVYVVKERKGPLGNEFYVEKVIVSIGDSDNTKTAVLSGLTLQDKVVLKSDKLLSDGSRVMLIE